MGCCADVGQCEVTLGNGVEQQSTKQRDIVLLGGYGYAGARRHMIGFDVGRANFQAALCDF